jgi:alpha-tubulin suppressor-like RCC1 family protein
MCTRAIRVKDASMFSVGMLARTRRFVAALALASLCLCVSATAAAAKGPKPVISNFKAAPAGVASGGATTVTATVSGAKECTLSSNRAVVGLPATLSCEGGSVGSHLVMPANTGKKAAKYKLQLTAIASGGGKAKAKTTVAVSTGAPRSGTGMAVGAGEGYACGLLSSGHVECWGGAGGGTLGDGTTTGPETCTFGACSTKPVEATGITNATQVAVGSGHTCALLSTGHVECWGNNENGALGNGTTTSSDTPVEAKGITDAIQVTASSEHTCALLSTGHVECWGENSGGQLGDGIAAGPEQCGLFHYCSTTPVEATGITDATQVAAGNAHSCALLSTGHVECWGRNASGALGDGTTTWSDTPLEATGITNATQVAAGNGYTCALLPGSVDCWGNNASGQLGDGATTSADMAVPVSGIVGASQATAGSELTCALLSTGHVECWGENGLGQLGDGTTASSDTPVEVMGI